jgi:hypothetical protein
MDKRMTAGFFSGAEITEPVPDPDYSARVQQVLDRPELYGLTPGEAAAQVEADMEAETYADRWQAWAESREPEPEPEPEADWEAEWDDAESSAYVARVEAGLELEAEP